MATETTQAAQFGETDAIHRFTKRKHKAQSSSCSSWRPRVREDAVRSTHSTGRPGVRLTPAPKPQGDPSIDFQPPTSFETCAEHLGQVINKLKFPVREATWSMFVNDCMWAVFHLGQQFPENCDELSKSQNTNNHRSCANQT